MYRIRSHFVLFRFPPMKHQIEILVRRGFLGLAAAALVVTAAFAALASGWNRPVTLLLLGADSRDDGGPARSDAIVVLRANPRQGTMRGLSLPRDLYVSLRGLPVYRVERLNAALFFGDYYADSEGLRAARETVSELINVPVDGAVVVPLPLVEDIVDALGGIDVYCEKELYDPAFNPYSSGKVYRLLFPAGWNHLDGQRAMEFLRVRRPDTDFGRMNRSRQFVSAVSAKLRSPRTWIRLPAVAVRLWRRSDTDLGPVARLRVLWALALCSSKGIAWDGIEKSEVLPYVTSRGAQVLLPEPGVLKEAGRILTGEHPVNVAGLPVLMDQNVGRP